MIANVRRWNKASYYRSYGYSKNAEIGLLVRNNDIKYHRPTPFSCASASMRVHVHTRILYAHYV